MAAGISLHGRHSTWPTISRTLPPSYNVLWSCGETMIGVVQLKRYFAVIGGAVRSHAVGMKLERPAA